MSYFDDDNPESFFSFSGGSPPEYVSPTKKKRKRNIDFNSSEVEINRLSPKDHYKGYFLCKVARAISVYPEVYKRKSDLDDVQQANYDRVEEAMKFLSPRKQRIVKWSFGLTCSQKTQREIASLEGISQAAVSKSLKLAIEEIKAMVGEWRPADSLSI